MNSRENIADTFTIAGRAYRSRLLVGTGKYRDFAETRAAIEASNAEIITVAIRRVNIGQNPNEPSLLEILPPSKFTILFNTAGCYNAAEVVRTLRLGRELLDGHALVKLEVLSDDATLFPNMFETIIVAKELSSVIPQQVYKRGSGKAEVIRLSSSGGIAAPAMMPNVNTVFFIW